MSAKTRARQSYMVSIIFLVVTVPPHSSSRQLPETFAITDVATFSQDCPLGVKFVTENICTSTWSCRTRCGEVAKAGTFGNETLDCSCDHLCPAFGDCCWDFEDTCPDEVSKLGYLQSLVSSSLKTECGASTRLITSCENGTQIADDHEDDAPVTETTYGLHFKNKDTYECAMGENKSKEAKDWRLHYMGIMPEVKEVIRFLDTGTASDEFMKNLWYQPPNGITIRACIRETHVYCQKCPVLRTSDMSSVCRLFMAKKGVSFSDLNTPSNEFTCYDTNRWMDASRRHYFVLNGLIRLGRGSSFTWINDETSGSDFMWTNITCIRTQPDIPCTPVIACPKGTYFKKNKCAIPKHIAIQMVYVRHIGVHIARNLLWLLKTTLTSDIQLGIGLMWRETSTQESFKSRYLASVKVEEITATSKHGYMPFTESVMEVLSETSLEPFWPEQLLVCAHFETVDAAFELLSDNTDISNLYDHCENVIKILDQKLFTLKKGLKIICNDRTKALGMSCFNCGTVQYGGSLYIFVMLFALFVNFAVSYMTCV